MTPEFRIFHPAGMITEGRPWGGPPVAWAMRQRRLLPSERIILVYLALYADEGLTCRHSQPTIAAGCELTPRRVRSAIGRLAGLGLVRITAAAAGEGSGNEYRLLVHGEAPAVPEMHREIRP